MAKHYACVLTEAEKNLLIDALNVATSHLAAQIGQAGLSAAGEGAKRLVEVAALASKISASELPPAAMPPSKLDAKPEVPPPPADVEPIREADVAQLGMDEPT